MSECDHGPEIEASSLCPTCRKRRKNVLNRLYVRKNRRATRRRPGDVALRASDVQRLGPLLRELDDALDVRDGTRIRSAVTRINRILRQPVLLAEEELNEIRRKPAKAGRPPGGTSPARADPTREGTDQRPRQRFPNRAPARLSPPAMRILPPKPRRK